MSTRVEPTRALEREWWLRTIALVLRPQLAFVALRDEPEDAAPARSEPMLAVTWLAGIAAVLASSVAVDPLDRHIAGGVLYQTDGLVFTVWVFLAGGAYGFVAYWLIGGAVYIGARAAGSFARYRLARHVLVFAAFPVALSLLLWPVRLAIYGGDVFRSGGADNGLPNAVFTGLEGFFFAWAVVLLVLGVRIVYRWSWPRSLAAVALAAVVLALFGAIPFVL